MGKEKMEKMDIRFKETEQEPKVEQKTSKDIPMGYIKIFLDSCGKLYAPKILHFRNYSMKEVIHLASIREENDLLEALVSVLNKMVYENFDCAFLHEKELCQILLSLYANFWGSVIEGYKYKIATNEEELKLFNAYLEKEHKAEKENKNQKPFEPITDYDDPRNTAEYNIPVSAIKTKPLENEKIGKTVNLTIKKTGETIVFDVMYVGKIIEAKQYIEDKYFAQERKYSDFKPIYDKWVTTTKQIEEGKATEKDLPEIDKQKAYEYEEYLRDKMQAVFDATSVNLVRQYGKKSFKSLKEKISFLSDKGISTAISLYSKKQKEKLDFGLIEDLEFPSKELGMPIVRRFLFQFVDFIPNGNTEDIAGYDFSFDD